MTAAGLAAPRLAGAQPVVGANPRALAAATATADFLGETASAHAREIADWVMRSRDNAGLPFVIIDKFAARVFVFGADGRLRGAAPGLLGSAIGDDSADDIGRRRLAAIPPAERTTPAGRFQASLGHDFEQDILWVDYAIALSLHRVVKGNPKDRRHARLASPTPDDNRISYGCINVPAVFYDTIVAPAFAGTVGIVYILPETRPIEAVFAMGDADGRSGGPQQEAVGADRAAVRR